MTKRIKSARDFIGVPQTSRLATLVQYFTLNIPQDTFEFLPGNKLALSPQHIYKTDTAIRLRKLQNQQDQYICAIDEWNNELQSYQTITYCHISKKNINQFNTSIKIDIENLDTDPNRELFLQFLSQYKKPIYINTSKGVRVNSFYISTYPYDLWIVNKSKKDSSLRYKFVGKPLQEQGKKKIIKDLPIHGKFNQTGEYHQEKKSKVAIFGDVKVIQRELAIGQNDPALQVKRRERVDEKTWVIDQSKFDMDLLQYINKFLLGAMTENKFEKILHVFSLLFADLKALHENIVHRDIKPENILINVDEFGNVTKLKIADYDKSDFIDEENKLHNAGTLLYMAPETFADRMNCKAKTTVIEGAFDKVTRQQDMWSLGVTCLQLLGLNLQDNYFEENETSDRILLNKIQNVFEANKDKLNVCGNKTFKNNMTTLLETLFTPDYQQRPTAEKINEEFQRLYRQYKNSPYRERRKSMPSLFWSENNKENLLISETKKPKRSRAETVLVKCGLT